MLDAFRTYIFTKARSLR